MPKLSKHERPQVKVDASGASLDLVLTKEQAQGLWEKPGATVVAIVTLASTSYVGHATDEEKPPTVKLRIVTAEVARDDEEAASILEAGRAMYRRRTWDGTFEEAGLEPIEDPGTLLRVNFAEYPSEEEYQGHQEAARVLRKEQRAAEDAARQREIANA